MDIEIFLYVVAGVILFIITTRVVARIHKFPIPHFLVPLIDNPVRFIYQPPKKTMLRHGVKEGMKVLEIGPGGGSYTLAAAKIVSRKGGVVAVDIQPQVVNRLKKRAKAKGIKNLQVKLADAQKLPFKDKSFDLIFMIGVIGEVPDAKKAIKEFNRVLTPSGKLAISEIIPDPHYSRAGSLIKKVLPYGFKLKKKIGNFIYYTLIFEKVKAIKDFA